QFRIVESSLLRESAGTEPVFVLPTAGAVPCHHLVIDVINGSGISVSLNVPVHELIVPLKDKNDRPLLKNGEDLLGQLTAMRKVRLPFYQRAHITLQRPDLRELLEKLQSKK